jgi:hypothetical protein
MYTASGGQYVPILFFRFSKLTAVLMPTDASTAAMTVVGTWTRMQPHISWAEYLGSSAKQALWPSLAAIPCTCHTQRALD